MGRRFVGAWHRAERGELIVENAERHVGFENFAVFSRIITPKRLELLRHVHRHPERSIRALAIALGRDYRRVHADVAALTAAGLLDRDERGLCADYATVKMETKIAR
jgi:predicted transcriptional regulator